MFFAFLLHLKINISFHLEILDADVILYDWRVEKKYEFPYVMSGVEFCGVSGFVRTIGQQGHQVQAHLCLLM